MNLLDWKNIQNENLYELDLHIVWGFEYMFTSLT